ncbi:hypothetical protein F2P44_28475 [Massilia sp. CCM 8695]|uniref:Energy transducer TonB n=1 Tax=Massilia frigida TaxID=2609281 RepID=A0ABX0NJJ0_9BURK|nr:hypothetical protein [Massilia frigida]NHZ83180.1 hypothetical protein [Massilia frigida]
MMEYRFNFTPRLVALGLFTGVALLVLLFSLGFQLGVRMAGEPPAPVPLERAAPAPKAAS